MVEVTREDREAAADYHANGGWGDGREHWLASVVDSHPLIQAFARHRIAAENAALERAAKVADDHCYMIDIDEWMAMTKKEHGAYACRSVATAIRALKGPSNAD